MLDGCYVFTLLKPEEDRMGCKQRREGQRKTESQTYHFKLAGRYEGCDVSLFQQRVALEQPFGHVQSQDAG